ncbi:MAG: tRNA-intron lyase [Nanoarchaeota archaeon]
MEKIKAYLSGKIITSNASEANDLYAKSSFGEPSVHNDKIQYTVPETLFLLEKGKLDLFDIKNKIISTKQAMKKFSNIDKKINIKYPVYRDLRERGYIVKTALKFGAEFRVYDKGAKPGKKHAKWIVYSSHESEKFTWHDFSAKNRVAHSTKKNLLLAVLDEEGDISYYEVAWKKP